MKLTRKANAIFDRIIAVLAFCAAVLLVLILLLVNTEVVARHSALGSMVWVIEIIEYCLLWITFLGTAWVLREEGHVRMDMVLNRLNVRNQSLLNTITSVVGAIACLVIAWYAVEAIWYQFQHSIYFSSFLEPLTYPILAIIPVGSFLLVIQFARRAYGFFESWRASGNKQQTRKGNNGFEKE